MTDFYEIVEKLKTNSLNECIRPAKIKKAIAFKACKMSYMVGDHLDTKAMKEICQKLS